MREKERHDTHKTCSEVMLVNDIGMGPVKLLLLSRLSLHKHSKKKTMLTKLIDKDTQIIKRKDTKRRDHLC